MGKETADEPAAAARSEPIRDADRLHAVIRFRRDVQFPRFGMRAGERWGFVVFRKNEERLKRIKAGERFDFAGGQCLAEDVEIVYEGPCGVEYSVAVGCVAAPAQGTERGHHQGEAA